MPRKNKFATNKDIAKVVRKKLKIKEDFSRKVIDQYLLEIKASILKGERVNLKGFGSFELKKWQTDSYYSINEKRKIQKELKTVSFKPSPEIKKSLDD
jgi:nucleoid DNA-binding protein